MFLSNRYKLFFLSRPIQLALLCALVGISAIFTQSTHASVREARVMESDDSNIINPAGIAFSPVANVFYILENSNSDQTFTTIATINPLGQRRGSARIAATITNPINTTFDSKNNRLLIYKTSANKLIEVQAKPNGTLNPATLTYHNARNFGLKDPQGMTVDPVSGNLFILDVAVPRIVRIEPDSNGSFDNATVTEINLKETQLSNPHGIAFDPSNNHLYTLSQTQQKLFELTQTGKVVTTHDVSRLKLSNTQTMVVAPSGDLTDDVSRKSVYIVSSSSGDSTSSIIELAFSSKLALSLTAEKVSALLPPFTSDEVKTTATSGWAPPSPDPAGITYLTSEGKLLVSDSEVNETLRGITLYDGVNLFKATLSGDLLDTTNTLAFSAEPTGTAFKSDPDPSKERLFISDDDAKMIFVFRAGPDGLFGTADDGIVSQFSTNTFDPDPNSANNSNDPEGLAFDKSGDGTLYIADGVNSEIYAVKPGPNGLFDGIDDVVTHFDTQSLGVTDPEGITFDTNSSHLYIIGEPQNIVAKISTNGVLVQDINIETMYSPDDPNIIVDNNYRTPAGLAFAPSSVDPSVMSLFIVNRQKDNNIKPYYKGGVLNDENNTEPSYITSDHENDGLLHEMTLPIPSNLPPTAGDDTYSTTESVPLNIATLGVLGNDSDPEANMLTAVLNNGPTNGTLTLNSDGSFIYTPNPDFAGTDSFTYHVNDGVVDSNVATVILTVIAVPCP